MPDENASSPDNALLVAELFEKVTQLEAALVSRVVIEQAKGMVAVRDRVGVDVAFERLRRVARDSRRPLSEVARGVVAAHESCDQLSPQ